MSSGDAALAHLNHPDVGDEVAHQARSMTAGGTYNPRSAWLFVDSRRRVLPDIDGNQMSSFSLLFLGRQFITLLIAFFFSSEAFPVGGGSHLGGYTQFPHRNRK